MDALTLPSRVTAVTVFRRGALVTRTAILERGEAGLPAAVRLEGLPLLLDDESLQIELEPLDAGAPPVGSDLRVTLAVPEPDPELRPPSREELRAAELALALARQEQADLARLGGYVSSLSPGSRGTPAEGQPPMASPTHARLALLDLRRARLEALAPRMTAADERTRLAVERLETLWERERRASQATSPRTFEARKAVVVGLSSPSGEPPPARVELRLRYMVPGARWAPSYVLRLDPGLGAGVLELRALVGQATGERWSGVALTLSTADPQQWTELPELRALRIGRRQPPPPKTGWRPPPPGTDLLYADYDRLEGPEPPSPRAPAPATGAPRNAPAQHTKAGTLGEAAMLDLEDLEEVADIVREASDSYALPESQSRSREQAKRTSVARAAAPMPVAAMPMAPPAAMAPRSAGLGSMIGGALDGLFGGGGSAYSPTPDAPRAPEEPGALLADRDQLEYGSLWLPPADDPRRGKLQRASRGERYGALASLGPEQVAAALDRGRQARARAGALEQRPAPEGHCWVRDTEGFDYAYEAQARVDVDDDGQLRGLVLCACDVETTPRYVCVPRETQDVFRVVALRNPLDAPLLPGPVDVYLGGRFALASTLEVTPPRGRVELGLGVEQAIKVARNVAFEEEAAGLLKRSRDLAHDLRVEIRNNLDRAAVLEVRERLPVTREGESDIEIVERSVDPAWEDLRQDVPPLEGGRRWKVEVPAGGERTLRASFAIRIPQHHEIVGGNRREG